MKEEYEVCPHCQQEIREKSTYIDGNNLVYHRGCEDKGPIDKLKPISESEIIKLLKGDLSKSASQSFKDITGRPIHNAYYYILKDKKNRGFYSGNTFSSPEISPEIDEALLVPGETIKYSSYDWSVQFDAVIQVTQGVPLKFNDQPSTKEIHSHNTLEEKLSNNIAIKMSKLAEAPDGWEGTVRKMKKHKEEIDNPFALAHWMKNKGDKPHYTEKGKKKKKFKKQK